MPSDSTVFDLQRLAPDAVPERHAVQKLHDDERLTFMLADFVDRADVGMVQRRRSTSLAPEAFQRLWVSCKIIGQELQSDEATKLGVLGLVDHTHPAAAQLLDDAVVRDGLTDHGAQAEMVGVSRW